MSNIPVSFLKISQRQHLLPNAFVSRANRFQRRDQLWRRRRDRRRRRPRRRRLRRRCRRRRRHGLDVSRLTFFDVDHFGFELRDGGIEKWNFVGPRNAKVGKDANHVLLDGLTSEGS